MTVDDVAFFLGIPDREVIYKRATKGSLPKPCRPDGSAFRPTMALLFRALDIAPMIEGDALVLFKAWQRGEWQLPGFRVKDGRENRRRADRRARAALRPGSQTDRSS